MNYKKWWPAVTGAVLGLLFVILMFAADILGYNFFMDIITIFFIIGVPALIGAGISLLLDWVLKKKSTKLNIIIIVVIVVLLILFLPIWCTSYYLPGVDGIVKHSSCGSIFNLFKVY